MKNRIAVLLVFLAIAAGTAMAAPPAPKADVERGAYLVRTMGCNDCHTPLKMGPKGPEPDMTRMLTGHPADLKMPPAPDLGKGPWMWAGSATMTAFAGPWGVSYSANLTPDPETGLGSWTEKTFVDAIRTGKHMGKGRPILPPMIVASLAAANDKDLHAIFVYLKSLAPMKNAVPQPIEPAAPPAPPR
jgi:mono/diheme cytochrome c family protein